MLALLLCMAACMSFASRDALAAVYWGSRGDEVRRVQQKLRQWGYYDGEIDGVYGQDTYDAVVYFQRKNGLTADGVAGSDTLAAMGISSGRLQSSLKSLKYRWEFKPKTLNRMVSPLASQTGST